MVLNGDVGIRAPRKKVWHFLTDPNQIGQCAQGMEKVEVLGLDEPDRAKLRAHGTATGSAADAVSEMSLSGGPDGSAADAVSRP